MKSEKPEKLKKSKFAEFIKICRILDNTLSDTKLTDYAIYQFTLLILLTV